jgi:hypothetical protein
MATRFATDGIEIGCSAPLFGVRRPGRNPLHVLLRHIRVRIIEKSFNGYHEFRVRVAGAARQVLRWCRLSVYVGIVTESGVRVMVEYLDLLDLRKQPSVDWLHIFLRQRSGLTRNPNDSEDD